MVTKKDQEIRKALGEKLKTAREKAKLTQVEVAKKAKMSANYYAKIERGIISTAPEKLYKIFKALNVEASDIFPH